MNIIPMRCENCGGTLEMSDVSDVWVCPFCGTKNVLSRSSENETTEKRVEGMQKIVYQALSAANTEKAQSYAKKMLDIDESNADAWLAMAEASMMDIVGALSPLFGSVAGSGEKVDLKSAYSRSFDCLEKCMDSLDNYCSLTGSRVTPSDVLVEVSKITPLTMYVDQQDGAGKVSVTHIGANGGKLVFSDSNGELTIYLNSSKLQARFHDYRFNIKSGSLFEKGTFDDNGHLIEGIQSADGILLEGKFENGFLSKGRITYRCSDGKPALIVEGTFKGVDEGLVFMSGKVTMGPRTNSEVVMECLDWKFSSTLGKKMTSKSKYRLIDNVKMTRDSKEYTGGIYSFVKLRNAPIEYKVGAFTKRSDDPCHFIGQGILAVDHPFYLNIQNEDDTGTRIVFPLDISEANKAPRSRGILRSN